MCFSAEASFSATILLGVSGIALVNKFKRSGKLFLALIPIFFAIQQFSEGMLWLSLNSGNEGNIFFENLYQKTYMFFAYLFWPVWIPIAYLMSEKIEWRRSIMSVCLMLGMMFYCYVAFGYFSSTEEITPRIVGHSIVYAQGSNIAKLIYVAIILLAIFSSSIPNMWVVGVLTGLSFFAADYFYTYAYASVWCFASAIIYSGLYFVLKPDKEESNRPIA